MASSSGCAPTCHRSDHAAGRNSSLAVVAMIVPPPHSRRLGLSSASVVVLERAPDRPPTVGPGRDLGDPQLLACPHVAAGFHSKVVDVVTVPLPVNHTTASRCPARRKSSACWLFVTSDQVR